VDICSEEIYTYEFSLSTMQMAYGFRLALRFLREDPVTQRGEFVSETLSAPIFVLSAPRAPLVTGAGRNLLLEWEMPSNYIGRPLIYVIEEKVLDPQTGRR
jgi:hypothetical protein